MIQVSSKDRGSCWARISGKRVRASAGWGLVFIPQLDILFIVEILSSGSFCTSGETESACVSAPPSGDANAFLRGVHGTWLGRAGAE